MTRLITVILFCSIFNNAFSQTLFKNELNLPIKGISKRITQRPNVKSGETIVLFDQAGPGCVLHWWMTCKRGINPETEKDWAHQLRIRFYYDNASLPSVDLSLTHFFSIMFDHGIYKIDNAALKVLPLNAFNCYFPIPFQSLRIELENTGPGEMPIWFMGDWQQYPQTYRLTPLRFIALYQCEAPADAFGSIQMADLEGSGFIAGMVQAVSVKDKSDSWYHTGGDTYLLDGETAPNPIRGIGGEDVFNMSFGIWPEQNSWVGAPLTVKRGEDHEFGSGYDGVMYRIFGPDPVFFETSASLRFGTKANDTESMIYAYLDPKPAPKILSPKEWKTAGPFECKSYDDFMKREWAEDPWENWPSEQIANFGVYISNLKGIPQGPTVFGVPGILSYEHGWCDFVRLYRGRGITNLGAQPVEASAYASGEIRIPEKGNYALHVGFDDWIKVWIDGREVFSGRHNKGFDEAVEMLDLPAGEKNILVKLSNFDNLQWRNWAFTLRLEKE